MRAAKARGRHLGRPATSLHIVSEIEALFISTDLSIRAIQKQIAGRASRGMLARLLKASGPYSPPPFDHFLHVSRTYPLLARIAEFERDLTVERIRSGIAAAKIRGARLGRQAGEHAKSDRLAPKLLALVEQGRSYRLIGRGVGLSKNTVTEIVKRNRTP